MNSGFKPYMGYPDDYVSIEMFYSMRLLVCFNDGLSPVEFDKKYFSEAKMLISGGLN